MRKVLLTALAVSVCANAAMAETVEVTCETVHYEKNAIGQTVEVTEILRGSGLLHDGFIFTAAHTFLDENGDVICEKPDYPFQALDVELDIAVLGSGHRTPQLPYTSREVSLSEMVTLSGFPLTFGFMDKRRGKVIESDPHTGRMVVLGRAEQGMSGGPAFSDNGEFLGLLHGITYPGSPNEEPFFHIISTSDIQRAITGNRDVMRVAEFRSKTGTTEVAELGVPFTGTTSQPEEAAQPYVEIVRMAPTTNADGTVAVGSYDSYTLNEAPESVALSIDLGPYVEPEPALVHGQQVVYLGSITFN